MMSRAFSKTAALAGLSLAFASNASATPWMIQLVLETTPTGFSVLETWVTDCEANDWKTAGSGFRAELLDGASGALLRSFDLSDPRMVFVEPPDGGVWTNDLLVVSGDARMFPRAYAVLSFPADVEGQPPVLPVRVRLLDGLGQVVLDTTAKAEHLIAGDAHGCAPPQLPPG
jgi:hypothetical protein